MTASTKPLSKDTVWFVTGSSSGLGRSLCTRILSTGHQLVATARNPSTLTYLPSPSNNSRILTLALDVTSPSSIKTAFAAAVEKFGRVDIVVNNAGYSLSGDTEGISDEDARMEMDTNFWGTVDVTREAVMVFREVNGNGKGEGAGGLVVQVSSLGGWVAFPGSAFYHASKFAVEGFTESLSKEYPPSWNINFLLLEPGGMSTSFSTSSLKHTPAHPSYADPSLPFRQLEAFMAQNGEAFKKMAADPDRVAEVTVGVILEKGMGGLPLRLPFGVETYMLLGKKLEGMTANLGEWKLVGESVVSEEQKVETLKWIGMIA